MIFSMLGRKERNKTKNNSNLNLDKPRVMLTVRLLNCFAYTCIKKKLTTTEIAYASQGD